MTSFTRKILSSSFGSTCVFKLNEIFIVIRGGKFIFIVKSAMTSELLRREMLNVHYVDIVVVLNLPIIRKHSL